MLIEFATSKLRKRCEDTKLSTRTWGPVNARLLRRRLDQIQAADTLAILCTLPGARCHPLHHDREGQWAVDLVHPMRLIFAPLGERSTIYRANELRRNLVTAIRLEEVTDYHGE